jgi:beta-glucosidase
MENRTYRYSKEEPLFPFGFGLSYSQFVYSDLKLNQSDIKSGQPVELSFCISNTGKVEADEVAQIYLRGITASVRTPYHKLIGFQRIHLKPAESGTVSLTITPQMMMLIDNEGVQKLEPGEFEIHVGGCSPCNRAVELGAPEFITGKFTIS